MFEILILRVHGKKHWIIQNSMRIIITGSSPVLTTKRIKMKNLLVEKTEVKLNDEDKIKNFIEESKSNDGVIIKIQNNIYRHLIDKDGRCFIKNKNIK